MTISMRDLTVQANDDGGHIVVEVVRRELGVFATRAHADLFVRALLDMRLVEAEDTPTVALAMAPPETSEPSEDSAATGHSAEKTANSQVDPANLPVPLETDDSDLWSRALDRIEKGESVKDVASSLNLSFTKLRAKWAGAVSSGARKKPAPPPRKPTAKKQAPSSQSQDGDDSPVSGGAGAVQERGKGLFSWTPAMDAEIIDAKDTDLKGIAEHLGRTEKQVVLRRDQLQKRLQQEIAGTGS